MLIAHAIAHFALNHFIDVPSSSGNTTQVRCRHCSADVGVHLETMENHIAKLCKSAPKDPIYTPIKNKRGKKSSVKPIEIQIDGAVDNDTDNTWDYAMNEQAQILLSQCIYDNHLAFDLVESESFIKLLKFLMKKITLQVKDCFKRWQKMIGTKL